MLPTTAVFLAPWRLSNACKPATGGQIIQIGSALSYRSIPLQSGYCGAKHAIRGFTDSLRSELIHEKIEVDICMVQLPAFNTPQFSWGRNHMQNKPQPLPPIHDPALAAEAVVWTAQSPQREVWVGFPTWKAILGNKLYYPGFSVGMSPARPGKASSRVQDPIPMVGIICLRQWMNFIANKDRFTKRFSPQQKAHRYSQCKDHQNGQPSLRSALWLLILLIHINFLDFDPLQAQGVANH
jgi:hypothetical protein